MKLLLASFALCACGIASAADVWLFDVFADKRALGQHRFEVDVSQETTTVLSQADFKVKALFVEVFSYEHENREQWADGCLVSYDALTDTEGETIASSGSAGDGSFTTNVNDEITRHETGCASTFAYWNPAILSATELFNPQTGELEPVVVEPLGEDTVETPQGPISAQRYRLNLEEGQIDVWYTEPERTWVALQSQTPGERTIRYVPAAWPKSFTPVSP